MSTSNALSANHDQPYRRTPKQSSQASAQGGVIASLARGSLGMSLGEAHVSSESLEEQKILSTEAESPTTTFGSNGDLIPRSSILLNPSKRKSFVEEWRIPSSVQGAPAAAVVLNIPAVPSAKDREKERERQRIEREKEIEREWREKEQAEKVWGIPKKAFYMGLGEINFNAQMAMLGGWGNGSGGLYDFRPTQPTSLRRVRSSSGQKSKFNTDGKSSSILKSRRKSASELHPKKKALHDTTNQTGSSTPRNTPRHVIPREPNDDDSESDESIDLEELAALNAIINTRRSMEAAQMLAKGTQRPLLNKRSISSAADFPQRSPTSSPEQTMVEPRDSTASETPSQSNSIVTPSSPSKPSVIRSASDRASYSTPKIRFAPLPTAYGSSVGVLSSSLGSDVVPELSFTENTNTSNKGKIHEGGSDVIDSDESDTSSDEENDFWNRRNSGSKSKW